MEEIASAVLWITANIMYVRYRRDDVRGFKRLLAFWFGFPITFFTAIGVSGPTPERRRQLAREAQDDESVEAELLAEIQRDRESRSLGPGDPNHPESGAV